MAKGEKFSFGFSLKKKITHWIFLKKIKIEAGSGVIFMPSDLAKRILKTGPFKSWANDDPNRA